MISRRRSKGKIIAVVGPTEEGSNTLGGVRPDAAFTNKEQGIKCAFREGGMSLMECDMDMVVRSGSANGNARPASNIFLA